jgi:hypothetical protein
LRHVSAPIFFAYAIYAGALITAGRFWTSGTDEWDIVLAELIGNVLACAWIGGFFFAAGSAGA